jgi:hypothetical protein
MARSSEAIENINDKVVIKFGDKFIFIAKIKIGRVIV